MQNIIEFFHVFPLFVIVALYFLKSKYAMYFSFLRTANKSLNAKKFNIVIIQLIISSIGVAFGANAHHFSHSYIIDPCLIYSAIMLFSAISVKNAPVTTIRIKK